MALEAIMTAASASGFLLLLCLLTGNDFTHLEYLHVIRLPVKSHYDYKISFLKVLNRNETEVFFYLRKGLGLG